MPRAAEQAQVCGRLAHWQVQMSQMFRPDGEGVVSRHLLWLQQHRQMQVSADQQLTVPQYGGCGTLWHS